MDRKLYMAEHIRVCRSGGDGVVLDLQRNRYFALGATHTEALIVLASSSSLGDAAGIRMTLGEAAAFTDVLLANQLLCEIRPKRLPRTAPAPAPGSILAGAGYQLDAAAPLSLLHSLVAIHALIWASRALKRRTLYSVVSELEDASLRVARAPASAQSAIELTNTFRRVRPYLYSARGRCLLHALTLRRFLSFFGINASWIIGVRTRPWAAHSWVQFGPLVLDGRPDAVLDYTPILVA